MDHSLKPLDQNMLIYFIVEYNIKFSAVPLPPSVFTFYSPFYSSIFTSICVCLLMLFFQVPIAQSGIIGVWFGDGGLSLI